MRRGEGAVAVVRGGDTWREFTRGTTEGGGGNGCIMRRREQRKDGGGAHLTPMEWAKERASEHDPGARRAFRCIRQAGLRWRRELGRVLPDPLGILPEGWMQE